MSRIEGDDRSLTKNSNEDVETLKKEVETILIKRLCLSLEQQFKTASGLEIVEKLSSKEISPTQAADLFSGL